jgi:hypothetical protein
MSTPTRFFSVASFFPYLKEQATLLCCGWWKIRALCGHDGLSYANLTLSAIPLST